MQKISVGEFYPCPVQDGMRANFLSNTGSVLLIGLPNMDKEEVYAFKKGEIRCGIIVDQPVILWVFDFGRGGQYDAPFDANLYSREQLQLHDISNEHQRLAIEMHVVEMSNNTIKALKLFTLPPELTVKFLSATQDQLAQKNDALYNKKLAALYQKDIQQLIASTKMYKAGT